MPPKPIEDRSLLTNLLMIRYAYSPSLLDQPTDFVRFVDHPCVGSAYHSPRPLLTSRYTHGTVDCYLCPTCRANLDVIITIVELTEHDHTVSRYELMREAGNLIRAIAKQVIAERVTA